MHTYASLSVLEAHLLASAQGTNIAQHRAILLDYARRATARIDSITHNTFAPMRQVRYFDCRGDHLDPTTRTIYLGASIAEVISLTDGTGASLTHNTDWHYYPRGVQSTHYLQGKTDSTWTQYADDWMNAIVIDGVWCHRARYDHIGWIPSGDTVQADVSADMTTIPVTDADEVNGWGIAPRFDVGQLIRIATEYMTIISIDGNNLRVIRGYNGTTATAHTANTPIFTFNPQEEIVRACALITAFNYANRGRYERVRFDGINATETMELPQEIDDLLAHFTIRESYGV